ncbi:MAG: glycosyltransferase family 39 protein [Roseiflexus sp.]
MRCATSADHTNAVARTLPVGRAALLIAVALLIIGLWNLEGPEFWWDEGWTLSVARNLVERGHYGRLLDGQPAPGGLEASPVVTLPVALSFRVFGVGLWQGRLVSLVCAAAALALMFALAARLYNLRVAWGTLGVLLLLTAHPQLNALLTGRQVLGEMPMLCALMGGYLALDAALRGRVFWVLLAALLWALALLAKAQTFPFWVVSVAGATGVALLAHRRRAAALVAGSALLAYLARPWVLQVVMLPVADRILPSTPVSGIYEVTAFVPNPTNRLFAIQMILIGGIPTLLGLGYAVWRFLKEVRGVPSVGDTHGVSILLRSALLMLAGSWFAWFALLSVGVPRYLFPATFVAGMFTAVLFHDLMNGFRLSSVVEGLVAPLRTRRLTRQSAGAWLATLLIATTAPLTVLSYWQHFTADERAAFRVAAFLNTQTPPDALIETYESELHFLLNRRYHYPPDQTHVELNRRSLLGQNVPVAYEPPLVYPSYLVVGRFAAGNRLYEEALTSGIFRTIMQDGRYTVYERIKE